MSERPVMVIRSAIPDDIPLMLQLDRSAAGASHWGVGEYQRVFHPEAPARLALIAEIGVPVGFLIARTTGSDWELENIAVSAQVRRKGVGTALLAELFRRLREAAAKSIFLEVRESNDAARCLYENYGFWAVGRRGAYYNDPPEDAVVYRFSKL